jgi:hypothetical protein
MEEELLNNPAGRLHRVLVGLQTWGDQKNSLESPLQNILGTENRADLLQRSGLLLALPREVWHAAESAPGRTDHLMRLFPKIERAMDHFSLAAITEKFVARLDPTAMHELETLGLHLGDVAPEPIASSESIDRLSFHVDRLWDEVLTDPEMPESLRLFLASHLGEISTALKLRNIAGLTPLAGAVDRSLGEFGRRADLRPYSRTSWVNKMGVVVGGAIALVSPIADWPAALETAKSFVGIDENVEPVDAGDDVIDVDAIEVIVFGDQTGDVQVTVDDED